MERQRLIDVIDTAELRDLLYGEILRPDQEVALQLIAEEYGVDAELLRPSTRDPETAPAAPPVPAPAAPREPTSAELAELEADVEDAVAEELVAAHAAEVAEVLGSGRETAATEVRSWIAPPHGTTAAMRDFLLANGSQWTQSRLLAYALA